jgi:hypothetical protein
MKRAIAALAVAGGLLGIIGATATPASAKPLCVQVTVTYNGDTILPLLVCTPLESPGS